MIWFACYTHVIIVNLIKVGALLHAKAHWCGDDVKVQLIIFCCCYAFSRLIFLQFYKEVSMNHERLILFANVQ